MFFLNFKYTLKALIRNKGLVFWTLAFPIIMAIFFSMAFSNIESTESFDAIPVAIVSNEYYENNDMLKSTIESLSDEHGSNYVFNSKYVSEDEAKTLLNNDEVSGYVIFSEDGQKVVVNTNGVNQTIIKFVVEEVVQSEDTVDIIEEKVANDESVVLIGFGTFKRSIHKARIGSDPNTHEEIRIPKKIRPSFRPGKEFIAKVGAGKKRGRKPKS